MLPSPAPLHGPADFLKNVVSQFPPLHLSYSPYLKYLPQLLHVVCLWNTTQPPVSSSNAISSMLLLHSRGIQERERSLWAVAILFAPSYPWTEESGKLQSIGSQRVRRYTCANLCRSQFQTFSNPPPLTPVFLPKYFLYHGSLTSQRPLIL